MLSISERLGRRIKALRKAQNMTQDMLAETSSLSSKYIGEVERGDVNVSIQVLDQLAKGLGIKIHELIMCEHEAEVDTLRLELIDYITQCPEAEVKVAYRLMSALR